MRIRTVRALATASLLASGLVAWPGCNAENPDGTKTPLGKMEEKAEIVGEKIKEGAGKAGHVIKEDAEKAGKAIKEGAVKAVDATGKAIENAGEKLEGDGKAATEKHLGEKAGAVVEGAGKALDKTGQKIQESVKPKE